MLIIPKVHEEVAITHPEESNQIDSQLWDDNSTQASETSSLVADPLDTDNGRRRHQLDVHMMAVLLAMDDSYDDMTPSAKRRREHLNELKDKRSRNRNRKADDEEEE